MKLTKEQAAEMLNGREYGDELDGAEEEARFKENRLVVVYGASDDLMEFEGAISEEVGCYDGNSVVVTADGEVLSDEHECDCDFCGYKARKEAGFIIEAVWCDPDIGGSWSYKTEIPHATFDIMDDGELYCRGIVFSMDDLKIGAK